MINLDPDLVAQMSLQRGINFRSLAEKMGNCSGAEVRGICTEAGKLNSFGIAFFQALTTIVCVSVGMYALRERRQYVGQEDFVSRRLSHSLTRRSEKDADRICYRFPQEMAVAKVLKKNAEGNTSVNKLFN
jgi:26S proteasome regulatory subunit T6